MKMKKNKAIQKWEKENDIISYKWVDIKVDGVIIGSERKYGIDEDGDLIIIPSELKNKEAKKPAKK